MPMARSVRMHAAARSRRGWRPGPSRSGRWLTAVAHIRNTPQPSCPSTGAECTADSAIPSTRAGVARIDDAVVPQARGGEERVRLLLDLALHDARASSRRLCFVERLPGALGRLAAHDREHAGELLGAHHRDPVVRPGEEEARLVGAAAHAVVAGAVERADHDRERRHRGVRHRVDQLRAVLDDAALLVALADHEAGDVLQEQERHVDLVAELDELRALLRRLGEQDAVVGEDADRVAVQVRPAGDQRACRRSA